MPVQQGLVRGNAMPELLAAMPAAGANAESRDRAAPAGHRQQRDGGSATWRCVQPRMRSAHRAGSGADANRPVPGVSGNSACFLARARTCSRSCLTSSPERPEILVWAARTARAADTAGPCCWRQGGISLTSRAIRAVLAHRLEASVVSCPSARRISASEEHDSLGR